MAAQKGNGDGDGFGFDSACVELNRGCGEAAGVDGWSNAGLWWPVRAS